MDLVVSPAASHSADLTHNFLPCSRRHLAQHDEAFASSEELGAMLQGQLLDVLEALEMGVQHEGDPEARFTKNVYGSRRPLAKRQHFLLAAQVAQQVLARRLQLLAAAGLPLLLQGDDNVSMDDVEPSAGRTAFVLLQYMVRYTHHRAKACLPVCPQLLAVAEQTLLTVEQLMRELLARVKAGSYSAKEVRETLAKKDTLFLPGFSEVSHCSQAMWGTLKQTDYLASKLGHWGVLVACCRLLEWYCSEDLLLYRLVHLHPHVMERELLRPLVKVIKQQLQVQPGQAVGAEAVAGVRGAIACLRLLIQHRPHDGPVLLENYHMLRCLEVLLAQRELAPPALLLLHGSMDGSAEWQELFLGNRQLLSALVGTLGLGLGPGACSHALCLVRRLAGGSMAVQEAVVGVPGAAQALAALLGHADYVVAADAAETFRLLQHGSELARGVLMEAAKGVQLKL